MIPLRFSVRVEGDEREAFVVRLRQTIPAPDQGGGADLHEDFDALIAAELTREVVFQIRNGYLLIPRFLPDDFDGDVLFVDSRSGVAHRWIRARSPHNTFLLTERCDQFCIMCSQPPKNTHVDLFEHFTNAALLAPPGMELGISGGEPTLYKKELFDFVANVSAARPDLRFHILTNAQHFTEDDLAVLRNPVFRRICWGVPLYAPDAKTHDAIVAKDGAFSILLRSLALLLRAGSLVELRTVIMRPNLAMLPDLAWLVATHLGFTDVWALMQLENIGFARNRWDGLFVDHSREFVPITMAADIALSRGINLQFYNCRSLLNCR
jgi:His-Xaa-Ser system radical SAM maturase HxsC